MNYNPYNSLQHHGVKGQRWGFRRYQNKDGTLTALGRKREKEMSDKLKSANKQLKALQKENETLRKNSTPASRNTKEMTDEELRQKINRLNMEKQYSDIYKQLYPEQPKKEHPGKAYAKKFLSESVVPALTNVGKSYLEKTLKKALGLEDKPDPSKALDLELKKLDYANKKLDYDNKKNPKVDTDADELKSLENKYKKLDWEKKIADLNNGPTVDTLGEEVKTLENQFKKLDWEKKIADFGKDDTDVNDVIKSLNEMDEAEFKSLERASKINEHLNKLRRNN